MIKVFKTDVQCSEKAQCIVNGLLGKYPGFSISFDLEDEEKILRIEGAFFAAEDIIGCLQGYGYSCVDLPIDLDV